MHDHIEEMGKNIVRREHPNEPKKHSQLWIKEEIEDILDNDMGIEATRCLKLKTPQGNSQINLKSFGKMKKLRYLELEFQFYKFEMQKLQFLKLNSSYSKSIQMDIPNSVRYLKCMNYPFLRLPKTFQANNLVELDMESDIIEQLWEEGEKKVFERLRYITLSHSQLKTFDFRITPNLVTLYLNGSYRLEELFMPVCCQKLKHLCISQSKLKTFDLGLTPNLETLSLFECSHFVKLHMSAPCPNLKFLNLLNSRLRRLDLELIPNLECLNLRGSEEFVEINFPGLKKLVELRLNGCVLLRKLPEDLGQSGCLKELDITDTCISHLPQSIFGLKGLHVIASPKLLLMYTFPSEIRTTTKSSWEAQVKRFVATMRTTTEKIYSQPQNL